MSKPNMIKRADGSYSKHGLWDSIRENKGSGKAPTKEMLKQEKKIKSEYGDGGTIHIKPENKGKFNATKKATGKTTEELTHSKNPVTKKRAIFAQNAAKWKHEEGGEIDPKNTFGLTGNYSRTPNPEAIESNYKLAADYQRRLGNFNAGLNANLGFDHNLPLNTEQFNGSPTIIPNANLGLNVDYDRNNNNFSGSFNYNPINQGINAEVTYKKRFADGGKTVINPIITKPITTLQDNTVNNFPQIKQKTDSSFNSNKDSLGQFFDLVGLRPTSYQSKTPIPFTQTSPKISKNISVDPEIENRNKQISVLQNEIKAAEQSYYKQKKEYDNFMNSSKKEPIPVPAPMPISIPEEITPIPQYRGRQGNATMDENWVLEYAKGGRVLPKYLVGGFNVGLGNKSSNLFTKNYAATPAGFGQTPATTSSNTTNAPQTNTTNAKTRNNNAAVGAGLGFAGDTTNLLFDNNVFGTRNEVTDSEGNVLGEAQSDAGSQTQGALSGALKGASAGAALGPWGMAGGALIGGVAGFLTADTGAEDKLNQIKRERNAQISFKNMLGKGPIENNSIQTNSQSLYANGGMKTLNQNHPEATEEVELGESAMLPNGMNLAFGGETHENGGLETNLPEGTRIFSDRIKSGKRTIASIAKPIQNKIEKLKDNNSKAGQNTIKLFENQLDNLFNEQEEIKQQQDMAQQRKYFAKGGLIKYWDGVVVGSINPKTGKPFTIEEIALNSNSTMQKPFGSEYAGNGNIYNGVQSRSFIPSVSDNVNNRITPNPLMTATDYQPGSYGFATDPVLNLNQPVIKPNYVPANSDQADYEYLKANPDIMKRGNIQPRPLSTLSPLDVKGTKMISPINNGKPFDLNQVKSNIAAETNLDKTTPPSEFRFNKGDIGTAGALGTSLLGNLIQRSNLNKVAPPRTLVAPTFTAGRTPVKADYSADLQSADNQFNAARRGVMMNSGNYSTQAGNLGQLRAEQLRNRSKILQNQNNANAVLINEYQKAQADAINKNALSNYTTDQENMENLYNYNLWKTGQTNAADASAFNTSGQMFNNMVTGQNQLDAAEMYRRMYAQKVRDDLAFKAMGGTVRNYFAKGGTVYSQKLQNVLKEDTNTKAAQMDAEYASYLDAKGQPLQDTFKSKVTSLEYKVLPRKEKDLYAAKLWEEAHGSAPTKSQVAATTKALDGKKTSSPGAKTVADTHNSQVPQLEATLPEVVITGKRSLNPQQMMDNKFGKPQVSNQLPAVPSKPVPDWVNKANNAKPDFNQPNVNEPVNEKPVVNKPKLQTETPNWLKNPLQPKFNRNEVGEPDNSGSSFNPDTNESKIEKGKKYVNNVLKPAIQEGRKRLNEMDITAGAKMNMETAGKISDKGKKVTETFVKNLSNGVKYAIPTSLRIEAKDILNNQLGTNFKVTEDDFTDSQKAEILKKINKYGIIDDYSKYEDKGMNKVTDQWNDTKNVRNSLGLFAAKQKGDTAYIKDVINYNEKQEGKVQKNYSEWYDHWNKGKNMNKWLSYPRAAASTWGSAGTDIKGGDDSKGTPVDIKLYNPKKRTIKKK